jgi:hypothetical protein
MGAQSRRDYRFCKGANRQGSHKARKLQGYNNKLGYVYVLIPEGITRRASLAGGFIERKIVEYESDLEQLRGEFAAGF